MADVVTVYIGLVYVVMAFIRMDYVGTAKYSYGICRHARYCHSLYNYGSIHARLDFILMAHIDIPYITVAFICPALYLYGTV